MRAAIEKFLASGALSDATRRAYRTDVEEFAEWLAARRLEVGDVDVRVLSEYAAHLGGGRRNGRTRRLAPTTIGRKLAAVRSFLRSALGPARVPAASLAPRRPHRLPDTPKPGEVDELLERLDGDGPLDLRNRALLELVYSAGL